MAQEVMWDGDSREIDIKNGRSGFLPLHEFLRFLVFERDKNKKPIFDANVHYVELFFRGNTMKNQTPSIRMWISAMVKNTGLSENGEPIYRVFADKVETAPPDFG